MVNAARVPCWGFNTPRVAGCSWGNVKRDILPTHYDHIASIADLDRLFDESASRVIILFNHDPSCPISARAFREMAQVSHDAAIVDVSRSREVTAAVARRTGLRHESPQVLVLSDRRGVWSASHFAISVAAVEQAVNLASQPPE
ncbi:MAG TPA: bacillithiol system redox-active protein YtxJ [Chloroflexi bacterium]|nr:bacillithiol system redox-active protein YtxJ [Chloroflexota bacterium]